MKSFIIRMARADEANNGWIWMAKPSRTVIRVSNPANKSSVYCQVRDIRDRNFLFNYANDPPDRRVPIIAPDDTIVMSQWYRDALGGFPTTADDNVTGRVQLSVSECMGINWLWHLRAACHHPDIVVRLGTRLGVLGTWLGVIGLSPSVLDLFAEKAPSNRWWFLAIAVVTAVLGMLACRAPAPQRSPTIRHC